jgi:hypothetical protein
LPPLFTLIGFELNLFLPLQLDAGPRDQGAMKSSKRAKLFFLFLFFCLIATRVSLADLRVILVSADKMPDQFTELFDVEASNANVDPIQFTIILKNNKEWERLVVRGDGKRVKEVRGLVQAASVEIIRDGRTAVEFPLVFTAHDQNSQSTTFKIAPDLLSDATAKIIVDGFGILLANGKLGFDDAVMFQIDLKSFVKPKKS